VVVVLMLAQADIVTFALALTTACATCCERLQRHWLGGGVVHRVGGVGELPPVAAGGAAVELCCWPAAGGATDDDARRGK
jgi:hypothetical protein